MNILMDIGCALLYVLALSPMYLFILVLSTPEGLPTWWRNLGNGPKGPSVWETIEVLWGVIWRGIFSIIGLVIFFRVLLALI